MVGVDGLQVRAGEGGGEDEGLAELRQFLGRHSGPPFAVHHELGGREGGREGGRDGSDEEMIVSHGDV